MDSSPDGIDYLDLVQGLGLDLNATEANDRRHDSANDERYARVSSADFARVCKDGERTEHLASLAGALIGGGANARFATALCLDWNAGNDPPLAERKVRDTVASLVRTHARNHPQPQDADEPLFDLKNAAARRFIGTSPPERDWVLRDCLPRGKTTMIVAPGGTGKSQLVLQLAYAIATGNARYSPWEPGPPGPVVVIGAEDEEEEYHRRVERLVRAPILEQEWETVGPLFEQNLFIVSRVGEDNLATHSEGGDIVPTPFVPRLAKTLEPLTNIRLIVWDPVARFRGGDENLAADTTRFVEAADRLAKMTGAAVLLVHHVRKGTSGGEQSQEAARGSSALTDGVRLQINLSVPASSDLNKVGLDGDPKQFLVAKITKTNYSAGGEPKFLRRTENGCFLPVDLTGEKKSQEDAQIARLVAMLNAEAAKGRVYSKSSFADTFGGLSRPFGVGIQALKQIIAQAIQKSAVIVGKGRGRPLQVRVPIPKAKLPPRTLDDGQSTGQ